MRNLGAVSPLRLALRATSPVSGRLTVASLPKVGEWSSCGDGGLCGIYGRSKPLPYRSEIYSVRGREWDEILK